MEDSDTITTKPTQKPIDNNQRTRKICSVNEALASNCTSGIVTNDQYPELYNQFKNQFLNKTTYNGENKQIKTGNIILQITDLNHQNENDSSISYLDLGHCEDILRAKYNISPQYSFVIYKTDIKTKDLSNTYVQYEVYNPLTFAPIDYKADCSKETISVSVPVNLNYDTKLLTDSTSNRGYNVFNSNDSFYNDICATYTTENGTDITLNDRKNVVEESGTVINFCQEGCEMIEFDNKIQKAKCDCVVEETKTVENLEDVNFPEIVLNKFLGELKSSNYLVMKCYNLLFDFELLKNNIGFFFMMPIFISTIALFIVYIIKGKSKIDCYIQTVLSNKLEYVNNADNIKKNSAKNINSNLSLNKKKRKRKRKKKKIAKKKKKTPIKKTKKLNSKKNN
jgi:hypothetical protein